MLSTLIYRSRARTALRPEDLQRLLKSARERNAALQITGILLFDGVHFVQLIEGPEDAVAALFATIQADPRHCNVVQLLRDHAPAPRFGTGPMALLDRRELEGGALLPALLERMTAKTVASKDDRVVNILQVYAGERWADHIIEGDDAQEWRMAQDPVRENRAEGGFAGHPCQFALQPIVEPRRRKISSFEFLIRSPSGGSPESYFETVPAEQLYLADLQSKAFAFDLVNRLGLQDCKLSINLLPMSLTDVPLAVERLLEQISTHGLNPRQVIVEVTEQQAISRLDAFGAAIVQLRRAGIALAIDDFGAGFAGLSLLAEFQPDKLKIDRKIIQGIHTDGPRQAIVRAIVQACSAMGIIPVAEGVETMEEWCWLQAAGLERFQGYLFARPALNGVPAINWPEPAPLAA